jgi:glycosyltransferase involved in cell wall biosynthesis
MRIARVLTRLNLGGPARQVLASDPLLAARGHVVRVFAGSPEPGEGDLFEEARARGIDVVRVKGLGRRVSPGRDFLARARLGRALRAFAPDVLHTHASKAGALGRAAAKRLPGVARVHTFHGHVLEGYFAGPVSRALTTAERRMASSTDRVIAVSHATAADLVRLEVVDETKLVVVPPGLDLEPLLEIERSPDAPREAGPLRKLVGAREGGLLVGVIGRLAPVKRWRWALDTFALLAARHRGMELVFVGDGDERRSLERAICGLAPDLAPRVHMVGAREDMPAVLADLDAVLLTSSSEGMPVALIEAAAAGLPVVATPVGGVDELVAHERTGFLGATVDELAFGLDQLASDPALRHGCGARGRVRVAERHGAARLADRLEAVYRAAVEERACAS